MSLTIYDLTDDWGWFVDIENSQPIYQNKIDLIKNNNKKLNYHLNKLDTIEEDEYDYYMKNKTKNDKLYGCNKFNYYGIDEENSNRSKLFEYIDYKSTTVIGVLTFVIFFVL